MPFNSWSHKMLNGKPLCIDGFCGLGGWAHGFLAEGWTVIGFDIERHQYPSVGGYDEYPGQLVLQDVLTLHGSQFRDADCLVFSPPCQRYSYMAMPFSRGKKQAAAIRADGSGAMLSELNALFNACFRIQREACEAAGKYIPLVVENVRGAQPWVGRAAWNFGSYYLWGDVPALMPSTQTLKQPGRNFHFPEKYGIPSPSFHGANHEPSVDRALKVAGFNFHQHEKTGKPGGSFQSAAVREGLKLRDADGYERTHPNALGWKSPRTSSGNTHARKAASAQIAKIPFALSNWIARVYDPRKEAAA